MKTTILTIITAILLIATVSAVTIYSGDTYTFESEQFEYYTTVGNESSIDGMEIFWENGNITITFNKLYESDSFTIIFFNEKTVPGDCPNCGGGGSSGGGGGTRVIYRDKIIPEIFEKEVIIEIPGDTITKTKTITDTIKDTPIWVFWVMGILVAIVLIFIYKLLIDSWYNKGDVEQDAN